MTLDRLPAWARHTMIAFFGAFVGTIGKDILAAGGVTMLRWWGSDGELAHGLNYGAVGAAVSLTALTMTPLTQQYGAVWRKTAVASAVSSILAANEVSRQQVGGTSWIPAPPATTAPTITLPTTVPPSVTTALGPTLHLRTDVGGATVQPPAAGTSSGSDQ